MALSLYRTYRPNVFADVVGQEHVERTLVNAVTEGSVAHAYLFCGPRGTGKTTTARLLAKALLCEAGPNVEPDGSCPQCQAIADGTHPDVYELDAASRTGVENVREEIIGRVNFAPTRGRYKVYIIDEVHMLSTAAFNALLKTLEEPPEHVVFVLCTTDPHKVPETIQSRCQRFDFKRFSVAEIVRYLTRICDGEGFSYETEALETIAAKSNGGMRDATTALEQLAVFADGAITATGAAGLFNQMDAGGLFEAAQLVATRDTAGCFQLVARLVEAGTDLAQFTRDFSAHIRDLYVTGLTGGEGGIVAVPESELARYAEQARAFGTERLSRALLVCGELANELRYSSDARLSVEVAFTRLCRPESDLTLEALSERVGRLEREGAAPPRERSAQHTAVASSGVETQEQKQEQATREQPAQTRAAAAERPHEQEPGNARATAAEQPQAQTGSASPMSPARLMQAVLATVKGKDVATGAMLNGVELTHDGNGYHLEFPDGAQFALSVASKDKARELIAAAFEKALGASVPVDFRMRGDQTGAPRPDAEAGETSAYADAPAADDGYLDALAASAPYEDGAPPAEEIITAPANDDPFSSAPPKEIDKETAAGLADALSAFGTGIKVQEIEE